MSEPTGGLRFTKMSGAGNDFILINGQSMHPVPSLDDLARLLCHRRTSVGADGFILVETSDRGTDHVRVRFWNPDGRETSTCGNGTRCAAWFAHAEGLVSASHTIETLAGEIDARVSGRRVNLRYHLKPTYTLDCQVSAPEGKEHGHLVVVGIPHFVIQVADLPEGPIEPRCRPLRSAPELGAEGANVHLVQVVDRKRIRIRSYERGVEAETLACGSGSISAALALFAADLVEPDVTVDTWGGETLTVRLSRGEDGVFHGLELEGSVEAIYVGELFQG